MRNKKQVWLMKVACYAATADQSAHAGHIWFRHCRAVGALWEKPDGRRWLEYYYCEGLEAE